MLDILFEIWDWCTDLDFVFPVVLCPFLLELQLCAISRHQSINEVDLNLVYVDHVGNITTRRIKCKVSVYRSIVGGTNFQRGFDYLRSTGPQSKGNRLLDNFEISLSEKFTVDVLNSFLCAVDEYNFEQNVIVVHLSNGFSVDGVWVSSQLVDLLVDLSFNFRHEFCVVSYLTCLFSYIKVSSFTFAFELPVYDLFVWLGYH